MKNKRLFVSLITVIALVFMMSANVFAAGPGSITIDDTANTSVSIVGNTYSAYKLFDVTYDAGKTLYVYEMDPRFESFFSGVGAYTDADAYEYVTSAVTADPVAFTAAVLTYLTANPSITAEGSATATTETVTISDIPLGYYLVKGTATAPDNQTITSLCILNTTNPSVTVSPKADAPTLDLQVLEDSNTTWGEVADYTVGQDVPFQITTTVPNMNGYTDYTYIIHDTLTPGFTFNDDITVTIGGVTLVEDTDFAVVFNEATNSFTVEILTILTQDPGAEIKVNFTAVLDDTAAIFDGDNVNTAYLEYSNNPYNLASRANTPSDEVLVDTYKLNIIKYTGVSTNTRLAGAHFELKMDAPTAPSVQFVQTAANYRVATQAEIDDNSVVKVTDLVSPGTGLIPMVGLDEGTYYLVETIAPAGYNKLDTPIEVLISRVIAADANSIASFGVKSDDNDDVNPDGDIFVQNNSGLQLPTTGGMGTTIFTVVGIILMAAAVTVLVARKKMQHNNK